MTNQEDEENLNTNTLVKELNNYFDTKLDAMKDQFMEENEKLAKRIKIDAQAKYATEVMKYNMNLIIPQ